MKKYIPIVGSGYTNDFFDVVLEDKALYGQPMLEVEPYHTAVIAFKLADDGLSSWNITKNSFLLFSQYTENYQDQILLVRHEDKYIIRVGKFIDPLQAYLTLPDGRNSALVLNSENLRIIGVLNGIIKPHKDIRIISNVFTNDQNNN